MRFETLVADLSSIRLFHPLPKLNDDLSWTMELGEAFLAQDKDVMDAMQSMRAKAQQVGTLKTIPQQVHGGAAR